MDRVRGKFGHEAVVKGLALEERTTWRYAQNSKTLSD